MRIAHQQIIPDHDEPPADTPGETARLRASLTRRERRIAFLKRKLRKVRERENAELEAAREIITGLEDLLLLHKPRTDEPSVRRIAKLEKQLAEMTRLAEMLFRRTGS